jgi:hypothetical protein
VTPDLEPEACPMPPVAIRYEQAVYGTFPFWDRGYAILASSPGCRDEWLADLRTACQKYGERPAGAAEAGGLIALRLESGPWAIIGPCPQGVDDRGRPGALAFHALFLSGSDYRKAGAFPFAFAEILCKDWTADTVLKAGSITLEDTPPADQSPPADARASTIANALSRGRRVAIEAPGPIDDLARQVWLALPLRRRRSLSLATWTFANGNHFDLAALPKLSGVALDRSYVDPETLQHPLEAKGEGREVGSIREDDVLPTSPGAAKDRNQGPRSGHSLFLPPPLRGRVGVGARMRDTLRSVEIRSHPVILALAGTAVAALALGILVLALRSREAPPAPVAIAPPVDAPPSRPTEAKSVRGDRVLEGLLSLAERFGTLREALSVANPGPEVLMMRLRERLAYNGPLLTQDDLARLEVSPDPDRARALAWHSHILHFRPDRPLPSDFARGPLDWQIRTLAWSFHLDPSGRPAEEIPRFLSDALSLPVPARPTPLADAYPALGDYARFLRRLPTR